MFTNAQLSSVSWTFQISIKVSDSMTIRIRLLIIRLIVFMISSFESTIQNSGSSKTKALTNDKKQNLLPDFAPEPTQ